MFRKTLTILSLIGLVLSMAGWIASYFQIGCTNKDLHVSVSSGGLNWSSDPESVSDLCFIFRKGEECVPLTSELQFLHREYVGLNTRFLPSFNRRYCSIPFWIPVVVFVGFPLQTLFVNHRWRKRKELGLCVKCGYNLRGSSERCPECGTGFEEKAKQP